MLAWRRLLVKINAAPVYSWTGLTYRLGIINAKIVSESSPMQKAAQYTEPF